MKNSWNKIPGAVQVWVFLTGLLLALVGVYLVVYQWDERPWVEEPVVSKIEVSGTGYAYLALEAVDEDGSVVIVFECRPGGPNGSECSQAFWEPLPVGTYRYQLRVAMKEKNGNVGLEVVRPVEGLTTTFVPWW